MSKLPFEVKRELLVKAEEETSEEHGCLPHKRTIPDLLENGVVNIDKPAGPTSHQVSEWVKKILSAEKAGHSGTLDPKVSGVFLIGLNNGTKVMQALLPAGKEYVTLMHLHEKVPRKNLDAIMREFVGKIYQKPPMKSAVKRVLRIREIYYMDLLEIKGKDVLFKVGCEAGTYIRRLCYDLGLVLGTGAHMQQLRRTKMAAFNEDSLVNLQKLVDAYYFWKEEGDERYIRSAVLPMEQALLHLPKIIISDKAVDSLCHGAQLAVPGILKLESGIKANDMVVVLTQKGEAVILGKALKDSEDMLREKKGIAIKTERVLIKLGTYPKFR